MNFEKYIGIPYVQKGRDENGVDCWGLVRLVYKNELDINLPSFSAEYETSDNERLEELFAQYKEGWESTDAPEAGDVVIFRIFGYESHIGVCIGDNKFLHVREARDAVIESLDNPKWSKRITGFFKYSEKKNAVLNTVPHPLRTERYTLAIVPGTTVTELVKDISTKYNIAVELKSRISILINGRVIAQENWNDTVIKEGDVIEYRAVPGKDALRTLAILAVVLYAPQLAGMAEFAYMSTAGATLASSAAVYTAAYASAILIGSALINAIAPIRPPSMGSQNDPGSAERQLMVNGGSNRANPYGAIPVVLGKVRMTPLLGSTNFLTYENERDSYLSMLLVWGYGPLSIDESTFKIGEVPISSFTDKTWATANRITELTPENNAYFNALYGKDITQVNTAIELTCDGNPEAVTRTYSGAETVELYDDGNVYKVLRLRFIYTPSGQNVEGYFNCSTGFSTLTSANLTNIVVTDVSPTTKKVTATTTNIDSSSNNTYLQYVIGNNSTGTYTGTAFGIAPGPWFEAATNETVNSINLAIHFPQGLRYIKTKGDGSGNSFATPVYFRAEFSTDGGISFPNVDTFSVGGDTPKKDGFTFTKTYTNVNANQMIVRVRRETGDNTEDNPEYKYYFQSILQTVTFSNNDNPAVDPVGSKIAKTAFKIKATDQLNGRIEGISAIVQTYCKVWNGSAWVDGVTSNPAALMRYVLEHPANPKKITNANTQINLTQLQHFYNYCQSKGFEYNGVLGDARSVLDVIRDICAAGRASPALVDGKWTVIIDEPRVTISNQPLIIQHFTPHNSWNFEGSKSLPKRPDGLRVTYYDQDSNYQESEIIVYDIGKGSNNAELFESITLPGVTKKSLVIDHAKWHMAQMKLRPEIYTLESDVEYLVCNRGDRVKVMHDIPMWGLGSGRIKNRISNTVLELDEQVPMQANIPYTIRFRSKTGASITRNVVPKTQDGNYSNITLTSSVTTEEADVLDLFLFGQLNQESQDLIVLSIEPSNNKTARITLVDYGVTDTYNIFTDYLNLSASTVFESQITLPPVLQVQGFGEKIPLITGFVSDESVMERVSKGIFKYNINVAYFNASQLPDITESVEVQYDLASATIGVNSKSLFVPFQNGSANITDVKEGETYKVRMRYIGRNGKIGNWSAYSNHTVVGKINPPSEVTNFEVSADKSSGQLLLSWKENPEPDTYTYEIRKQDTGWGTDDINRLFYGDATKAFVPYRSGNFYIKAIDSSGNYSVLSTTVTFTPTAVVAPSELNFSYDNTSTNANINLKWNNVTTSQFAVAYYEVSYNNITKIVNADSISLLADWLGERTFAVVTVDLIGNKSNATEIIVNKLLPTAPTTYATVVNQGVLNISWTASSVTSLPVAYYEVRSDLLWGDANPIFKGSAFTCSITSELALGLNNFYIKSVDTGGNYSDETLTVSYTLVIPENPLELNYSFSDTSLSNATVTLTWSDVIPTFGLFEYELTYDDIVTTIKANTITLPANWIGEKTFTIKTVDFLKNKSIGKTLSVTKVVPNSPSNFRAQVIDNIVMFYWTSPQVTSLPIDHALLKRGDDWNTATVIGEKKGDFTTVNETQAGTYKYWIAMVDTDSNESTPVSISVKVAEPPDFIFHGSFTSDFTATKSSAILENGSSTVLMPVNTTETWQQHFTNNSWNSPSDQVSSGFPIYVQPSTSTGYYEETFDFGSTLLSSKITLTYGGTIISGSPIVVSDISISSDNITYVSYQGSSDIYATNFRYVKIRITVNAPTSVALYRLNSLTVNLDAKQKTDSNTVTALSSDTNGTIVNFAKEFIDVQSITISPMAVTPITAVYDFKDINASVTYSVTSNVCTVNYASHGFITGQKVRLQPSTGLGILGTYTITGYTTDTFTVNMTVANTSGNSLLYPESFRVYLFNSSGTRVNGTASWSVRGY